MSRLHQLLRARTATAPRAVRFGGSQAEERQANDAARDESRWAR